ncbi:hypothetical protein BGZ60DRAFT_544773, partial [Tricladium varicosporioides]
HKCHHNPSGRGKKKKQTLIATTPLLSTTKLSTMSRPHTQDFNTQCHFTMQLFSCGHKAWLRYPKINHVLPCKVPKPAHKVLCNNMMKGHPKEEFVKGPCTKCQAPTAIQEASQEEKPSLQLDTKLRMVEAVRKRTRELQRARAGVADGEMVVPRGEQPGDGEVAREVVENVKREDPAFFGEWGNPSEAPLPSQVIAESSFSINQNLHQQLEDKEITVVEEPLTDSDEEYDRAAWENEKQLWMSFPSIENGNVLASKLGFLGRLFGLRSGNRKVEEKAKEEKEWREEWEEVEPGDKGDWEVAENGGREK